MASGDTYYQSSYHREAMERHGKMFIKIILGGYLLVLIIGLTIPENLFFTLIVPPLVLIAVMLGYKKYCLETLDLSKEETGDSLYYMGFLFTATSLAAGLTVIGIELQGGRDHANAGKAIVKFLPSFGTALLTTIVGLCYRVVMGQGAGDVDTDYNHMKDELHRAAADLSAQANLAMDQFGTLLTSIRQRTEELDEEFEKYSGALQATFEESGIPEAAQKLHTSAGVLESAARSMDDATNGVRLRLEPAVELLASATDEWNRDSAAALADLRKAAEQWGEATSRSARAADSQVAALREQAGALKEVAGRVKAMETAFEEGGIREASQKLLTSAGSLEATARSVDDATSSVRLHIEPAVKRLATATDGWNKDSSVVLTRMTKAAERWRDETTRSARAADSHATALTKHTGVLVDVTGRVEALEKAVQRTNASPPTRDWARFVKYAACIAAFVVALVAAALAWAVFLGFWRLVFA